MDIIVYTSAHLQALKKWELIAGEHPDLRKCLRSAIGSGGGIFGYYSAWLGVIEDADERGDWKAVASLLEHSPSTRNIYGNRNTTDRAGGEFRVVINVERVCEGKLKNYRDILVRFE
jgi:hypothetical protein